MQELRLVAVSEDGSYLVLASTGRGTRFTLPVDDRLRAVVRGHFSRLGQYEIEVESPLRPKEIQARIRAGETAEEIAESAGIPVERIRWFEGPVLQEREYMAQQAQRVAVRRPGETGPVPTLGEVVAERIGGSRGSEHDEPEWDSWKRDDGTWRVRLSFLIGGHPQVAEWVFDPRRRHIAPVDEMAAQLSSLELDDSVSDTVTPLVPRRIGGLAGRSGSGAEARTAGPERLSRLAPPEQRSEPDVERDPAPASASAPAPAPAARTEPPEVEPAARTESADPRPRPAARAKPAIATDRPARPGPAPSDDPAEPAARTEPATRAEPRKRAEPAARSKPAGRGRPARGRGTTKPAEPATKEPATKPAKEPAAAAATPDGEESRPRPRRKSSARNRRASVPSWDEIMFGSRRPD